jgi:hypothetical protein
MVDHYGVGRLCFSRDFRGQSVAAEGGLRRFWEDSDDVRAQMRSCNQFCGVSHSVRRISCTLDPAEYARPQIRERSPGERLKGVVRAARVLAS